jgi:hypothetical protein
MSNFMNMIVYSSERQDDVETPQVGRVGGGQEIIERAELEMGE